MTALEKAEAAVQAAQVDSRTLEAVAAILAAQQLQQQAAPAPVAAPAPARPSINLGGGALVGGVAAVLVVGTVLTGLLLAVAVASASIALVALVLRWIIRDMRRG